MDQKKFLEAVRSRLVYHRMLGIEEYPLTEDVQQFLKPRVPRAVETISQKIASAESRSPAQETTSVRRPEATTLAKEKPLVSIEEIGVEVADCTACELRGKRIYPAPGRGGGRIRLMVVGDVLYADASGNLEPGLLFGKEQDLMLSRMLKAISLSSEQVFITNVIKCAIPEMVQPQASHVDTCVSFLLRQIAVLEPEVICAMGPVATRALLEKRQPLSSMRGKFHEFRVGGSKKSIPVLPTYHPTFLLQNPEMKKATWLDLQLLAKKLDLPLSM